MPLGIVAPHVAHRPANASRILALVMLVADLGMGAELGYISIPELPENGAELDLYFTPKRIGELLD